jgi:hypothetical protein
MEPASELATRAVTIAVGDDEALTEGEREHLVEVGVREPAGEPAEANAVADRPAAKLLEVVDVEARAARIFESKDAREHPLALAHEAGGTNVVTVATCSSSSSRVTGAQRSERPASTPPGGSGRGGDGCSGHAAVPASFAISAWTAVVSVNSPRASRLAIA